MVAVAIGGAALLGGAVSAYGASEAASAQEKAAARAAKTQRTQYAETRADLAPYRDAGGNALTQLSNLYGQNGADAQEAAFGEFRNDPGYEWARGRAVDSAIASRAAGGMGHSGGTLSGIADRVYNLSQQNYENYLSRLQAMASSGQNAAAQTGNFGANAAGNIANAQMASGNATAGGYINMANSFNNTLSNLAGTYGAYKGGAFGGGAQPNPYLNMNARSIFG